MQQVRNACATVPPIFSPAMRRGRAEEFKSSRFTKAPRETRCQNWDNGKKWRFIIETKKFRREFFYGDTEENTEWYSICS